MASPPPWWKGERGEYYVAVQFVLFALIGIGPRTLGFLPPWPEPAATIAAFVGLALMLLGAALAVWGLVALGSRNLTALPYPRDGAELVESGPYAVVRNPIYSGLIFGAFGWALWLNASLTLLFAIALLVLFDLKTRREERWLCERFPAYDEYQKRVKRLIPWVW